MKIGNFFKTTLLTEEQWQWRFDSEGAHQKRRIMDKGHRGLKREELRKIVKCIWFEQLFRNWNEQDPLDECRLKAHHWQCKQQTGSQILVKVSTYH